ncbi:Smr/MutS family protein [Sanyastnella coralliicola]|uniref:Smr/MutS family protein n=1 Tax=Sanyastnella coralliicola TaxID=3069118 RepID=UPI0027BADA29|nr:Smr/MutS family protein [Longitalea sp. SCSIO 12813]
MFRPGDKVRFLNETGEAVVIQMIDKTQALIEDETGFDYPYPVDELILVGDREDEEDKYASKQPRALDIISRNVDQSKLKAAENDFKARYKEDNKFRRKDDAVEVDLHLHEIVDNEGGMSDGEKLDLQMRHFERMMARAEREHLSKIVFIHGVGQGVLRNEIRKHLKSYYPNADFFDANYQQYGYGATEVRLRFN